MMSDQSMPGQEAAGISFSFGQRLSSARRALNLTQEQVAAELRLNVGLVRALEEEDYSRLPTRMYIAGYLRNYARLLKIPVEPLLTALDKAQLESPPLITEVGHPYKASHSKLFVSLFALVLVVVVVAGIVNWIQSQDFALFSGKQVEPEAQESNALLSTPSDKPADEPLVSETLASAISPDAEVETPVVEETTTMANVATPEEITPTQDSRKKTVQDVMPETKPSTAVKEDVELVLRFSNDSWVEVSDSRGERLVYDLYREGQSKQVTGIPPFNIFLGNAAVVTVEYNGRPYDISAHVRGKLARFQLGQAEDDKSNTE